MACRTFESDAGVGVRLSVVSAQDWLARNQGSLGSEWERLFVSNVLSRVDGIDFASLQCQLPFTDREGGRRYCDFAIVEDPGVRIALEVDGYDKRGTGSGMSRSEFVDWQRRQNALVSQGWILLRFANRDVRDHPTRCAEHIALLLRRERAKQEHQFALRRKVEDLEHRVQQSIDQAGPQGVPPSLHDRVAQELLNARHRLALAEQAQDLSSKERDRLKAFAARQARAFREETSTMKTTIWALTALVGFVIALVVFRTDGVPSPSAQRSSGIQAGGQVENLQGASCDDPVGWQQAQGLIGQSAAIEGPVLDVTTRDDVTGNPTWITVGAPFPRQDRLVLVIWGRNLERFDHTVLQALEGRVVCGYGQVNEFRGVAQIELAAPGQLTVR